MAGLGVAALVALALVAVAVLYAAQRGEMLPGVRIADITVGGMTADEARAAIARPVAERESDPVTFTVADRDEPVTLEPDQVDYRIAVEDTITAAASIGRDGSLVGDTVRRVRALWVEQDVDLTERIDADTLDAWASDVADELDRDPSPGSISIDPETLEVTSQPPRGGLTVQVDELAAQARAALTSPGAEELVLPAERIPRTVDPDDVEEVADRAREALSAPLTLTGAGASVTFEPSRLAPLIGLRERALGDGSATVELTVTSTDVAALFGDATERFETTPTNASFAAPRTPPVGFDDPGATTWSPVPAEVGIEPSTAGTSFELERATTQLIGLLHDGIHEAELDLRTIEADFTTQDAEDFNLTHLLGTFTTYHACCQVRVANIQRLADVIDGAKVGPGEQFSINDISGQRACSKGYQPAGTIVDGELVDTCGGGVSQFGTTTFNAAFFAGVRLDQWRAHSYYISRYPLGREATLSFGVLDVKFTNDTGNGILVKTSHTPTSVTVSIYGRSDVEQVRATLGEPYAATSHDTERRRNDDLPPGESEVVQSGIDGFKVDVARILEREDGSTDRRDITTVYRGRPEIIEYNPAPPPDESDGGGD